MARTLTSRQTGTSNRDYCAPEVVTYALPQILATLGPARATYGSNDGTCGTTTQTS